MFRLRFIKRLLNSLKLSVSHKYYSKKDFLRCDQRVFIHDGVYIGNPENLSIESDVYIGPGSKIFAAGGVLLGRGVVIGEAVQIMSSNHEYDAPDQNMLPFNNNHVYRETALNSFSWVGNNSIILPGVQLGSYCVIGAGSVVTKSTEDFGVYAGNPAKLIKYRKNRDIMNITHNWVASKNVKSIYFIS